MHEIVRANRYTAWAGVFVASLYCRGLRHAVISPGSSSSAWAMAFYLQPGLTSKIILDERVAAFYALGLAKALQQPVALICTSGTAGANYYPAIVEARMSGVPLIVVTADRPPEMQGVQSEQTVCQERFYGDFPVAYRQLPLPRLEKKLFSSLRDHAVDSYDRSFWPEWGPVHINAPLPYPIPFEKETSDDYLSLLNFIEDPLFLGSITPYEQPKAVCSQDKAHDLLQQLKSYPKGLITVGALYGVDKKSVINGVSALSKVLGWPVLVDALSPLRFCLKDIPHTVAHYDLILRHSEIASLLKPDVCVHVGRLPTSKVLRQWLAQLPCLAYHLEPRSGSSDPLFRAVRHERIGVWQLIEACVNYLSEPSDYQKQWMHYDDQIKGLLRHLWENESRMVECMMPWYLSQYLPEGTPLMISTSMPIRECEAFMLKSDKQLSSFCNRGANGLDGLTATSFGIAEGTQKASVVLIGDLGFLHDQGALLLNQNGFSGRLTIICMDNGGGSIFNYLDVARLPKALFESLWLTPQVADIPAMASVQGITVYQPDNWSVVVELLKNVDFKGTRLIYIKTDSKSDFSQRSAWIESLIQNLK